MTAGRQRLDVHTHLVPALPDEALAEAGLHRLDSGMLAHDGTAIGPKGLYDPEALLRWLDETGGGEALVSAPPPLYRQGRQEAATRRWAAALNDRLAELLLPYDRLHPVGYLPLDRPAAAAAELDRLADRAPVAFTASAGGDSLSLADPSLDEVWARLSALDAPLLLHPGRVPDPRFEEFYLHNLLGNPVETALAAAQLLLGGALGRFPALRVGLVHGGGALPALLGRLQRGVDTARPGVPGGLDLRSLARRLWVDDLAHDSGALAIAVALVGEDHVLEGSDWPFPMGDLGQRHPARGDAGGFVAGARGCCS